MTWVEWLRSEYGLHVFCPVCRWHETLQPGAPGITVPDATARVRDVVAELPCKADDCDHQGLDMRLIYSN